MGFPTGSMSMVGRRRLAGITDQQNPSNIWKFQWYSPGPTDAGTIFNTSGFLIPLSGSVAHQNDIKYLKDSRGNTVTVLATDEKVIIQVIATPDAAPGATSLAEALESASFPVPNGWVTISNAPVIKMGFFVDLFNAANWLYNGDGSIEMASDNEWGMRFSLTRFANISKVAAILV